MLFQSPELKVPNLLALTATNSGDEQNIEQTDSIIDVA
jgi:hypothetical protein